MVFPEHALSASGFGRFGRFGSVVMDLGEREVTVSQLNMVGISVYQTLKHGRDARAARSLKVAILDDGDNGFLGPFGIVGGAQFGGFLNGGGWLEDESGFGRICFRFTLFGFF